MRLDLLERLEASQKACFDAGLHVASMDIQAVRAELAQPTAPPKSSYEADRLHEALQQLVDWVKDGCPDEGYSYCMTEAQAALKNLVIATQPPAAPVEKWLEDPRVKEALHRRPLVAPVETCPNCNGAKRATYFSEQGMTHEERDCHVCRPRTTSPPSPHQHSTQEK